MRARPSWIVVLCLVPACVAVRPGLDDSLGTHVLWECENGDCQVTGTTDPPPDCDGEDIFVVGAGALAILCGASVGTDHVLSLHDASCRPIVCRVADDCPQWPDRSYGCDGGFCTTASVPLDRLDVLAICLRDAPRAETCAAIDADPRVTSASAMADAACVGGGCAIPSACRP